MARVMDADTALKLLNLILSYNNEGELHPIFNQAARNRYHLHRYMDFPLKAGDVSLDGFVWIDETEFTPEVPDGKFWDSEDYTRGMAFLNEFSLINVDYSTGYSNMHVLVHKRARSRMGDDERSQWSSAARCLLMDSITLNWALDHVLYRRDVGPHLEACQRHVKAEHDDPLLESEYQGKIALVFRQAGRSEAAESALKKTLGLRKAAFGLLDNATLHAMSQLARLYIDQGRYSDAEAMLRELLNNAYCVKKADEDNSKDTVNIPDADDPLHDARILGDTKELGNVLVLQDQKEVAAQVFHKILECYDQMGDTAKVRTYRRLEATLSGEEVVDFTIQEAMERLADAKKKKSGPDHPGMTAAKKTLAETWTKHGGYVEAEKLYNELSSARGTRRHWQRNGDLVIYLYSKTMYEEAINLMQECWEGQRVVFGPQHTLTLQSEHCIRQFHEVQANAPDYLNASLRNTAIQASIDALGDRAPEWMLRCEPESEEDLMRAHMER
ncbi:hypothetical protein VPNG_00315 [Cytospora leucostoma]|uniref:MalT-like TPR region domain-containing protein n=1 Tax=Cytospora leucostoma TaxID=1230097 RepID=A0A423XN75_9PEZI|nr:hypothetical protein VPNG_00315 [Cytospora leucostoma]